MIITISPKNNFALLPVLAVLFALAAFNGGKVIAAEGFLSVIDDLPLMEGLAEVKGSALVFSTPQGRIAEVSAKGISGAATQPKKVLAFYVRTLPQLGWKAAGATSWVREGERLRLAVLVKKGVLTAQFSLTPN
ncbi:MAG: hypothetical protein GKS01_08175 [Alphaproteobacteria bacterium]|nr:hypothetical protein [Alphaproteobacteria bacterium]